MFRLRLLALAALVLGGCSLINAPDEIKLGTGGNGASGAGGAGTGATGGGGAAPECTTDPDCTSLTNECGTGVCGPAKTCIVDPQPAGTACGAAVGDSCDLADTCDGNGTCVANTLPDGTFCEDCPAGKGNCALCAAGTCGDCSGRATTKTFRSPLAASGWTFTGGWGVYAVTPPEAPPILVPNCSDGLDNDNDGFTDFPTDPGCSAADDYFENDAFTACSNNFDDDSDGLMDLADPDCVSPGDDTENDPKAIPFDHPVLGTDGNRKHPYGKPNSSELENSTATSPPTVIPATLDFLSWNLDEGFNYDLKAVQVSSDGQSFTTIAICPQNQMAPYAFCNPVASRAPDQWDVISLPVPAQFIGNVGYVRFVYNTTDGCCSFERGWFIDALNFATDCACAAATDCAYLDSGCATGTCDVNGECAPAAANVGTACTLDSVSDGCAAPTCDGNGLCASNFLEHEAEDCSSCSDTGFCEMCLAGSCEACQPVQNFQNADLSGWTFSGDWQVNSCLSPNSLATTDGSCFPSPMTAAELEASLKAPVLGNNGSRTGVNPWTGAQNEVEVGAFITAPTTIPANLTFNSWHQDRGGKDTFNLRDKKQVRVSIDGGTTWTTVVNCESNDTVAFCQPWPGNTNRAVNDWDPISIPIPPNLVGKTGIFEFSYDTVDAGQGWERGWYVDDLNINRCDKIRPPWP